MTEKAKVYFLGAGMIAVPVLKAALASPHIEIAGTGTQPDKPSGRSRRMTPSPMGLWCEENSIPVEKISSVNSPDFLETLRRKSIDMLLVVSFGQILKQELLSLPRAGCINVHASLLPKYRGAAPIQWAILNGESQTGVTTMLMDEGLDTGDMLIKRRVKIGREMTAGELHDILADEGATALSDTLGGLEAGTLTPKKQDESLTSYAPMLDRGLGIINWGRTALEIHNQVRGLNPWPSALTTINKRNFKIHSSRPVAGCGAAPGTVIDTSPLTIACGDNTALQLLEVQLEGSKRMTAEAFLLGHPIAKACVLPD